MAFFPETYRFDVPLLQRTANVPNFGDADMLLYWRSLSKPQNLMVQRIAVVGCNEDALATPWKLLVGSQIFQRTAGCIGQGYSVYSIKLAFDGGNLLQALTQCQDERGFNLAHAFFNGDTLRFDVQTQCKTRAILFLKVGYKSC